MSILSLKRKVNWKRLLLMVVFILGIFFLLIWVSLYYPPGRKIPKEMLEPLRIKIALEKYHQKYLKYPQSQDMPSSIGEFMSKVPKENPQGRPYGWMDNTGDNQKYCIWGEIGTGYFLLSPCGEKMVDHLPTSLDECCELSTP